MNINRLSSLVVFFAFVSVSTASAVFIPGNNINLKEGTQRDHCLLKFYKIQEDETENRELVKTLVDAAGFFALTIPDNPSMQTLVLKGYINPRSDFNQNTPKENSLKINAQVLNNRNLKRKKMKNSYNMNGIFFENDYSIAFGDYLMNFSCHY